VASGSGISALDGAHVHHRPRPGSDHRRDEHAIQPDGREQVELELVVPDGLVQGCKPAGAGVRATGDVHDHVRAAEAFGHPAGHDLGALGCGEVAGDERRGVVRRIGRGLARHPEHGRAGRHEAGDDGAAGRARRPGHHRPAASEIPTCGRENRVVHSTDGAVSGNGRVQAWVIGTTPP
jgi:hypothetical protein